MKEMKKILQIHPTVETRGLSLTRIVIEIAPKRYVFKKRGFLTEYHTSVWQPFSSVEHEEITGPGYTKETLEYKYRQWEHEYIQNELYREYKPELSIEDIINS